MAKQTWNAQVYEKNARYVSDLALPVVELLAPQAGERILDLGCGDGVVTKTLQEMGCEMVGIDSSPELIEAARKLGLDVSVMDATDMSFRDEFDAVFSNAALHWMTDPDRVIQNVFAALRSEGRFVAECGGEDCVKAIHTALMDELDQRGYDGRAASPWYFPSAREYGERLERAGFQVNYIEVIPRPTPLPEGIVGFLETFGNSFTLVLPAAERADYIQSVRRRLVPLLQADDGTWTADYTRLRFKAIKP